MARQTLHYYRGARRLVSVTEAISLAGLVDFSGIPLSVLEAARDRGIAVHAWIDAYCRGSTRWGPDPLAEISPDDLAAERPEIVPYTDGFLRFLDETGFEVEATEEPLAHPTEGYAGTLDLRGKIRQSLSADEGRRWIIDVKATAAVPPESALQTAAYQALFRATGGMCGRRGVLHLPGDGKYRLVEQSDRSDLYDFLACVRIASWKVRHLNYQLED